MFYLLEESTRVIMIPTKRLQEVEALSFLPRRHREYKFYDHF